MMSFSCVFLFHGDYNIQNEKFLINDIIKIIGRWTLQNCPRSGQFFRYLKFYFVKIKEGIKSTTAQQADAV